MKLSGIKTYICVCAFLHFPVNALALNEYGLFLSPNLCLLSQQEESCEIRVNLRWVSRVSSDYCLYQSNLTQPIKCWNNLDKAQVEINFDLDNDITLSLVDEALKSTLYFQSIKLQRQVNPYRHKRRNPWRFF